jgi:DNA-directed RNA polymerase subunit RPC12/RpoP
MAGMDALKCDRCGQPVTSEEKMDYYGQVLCEECYMQALSPARACDPWAVRSAQTLSSLNDSYSNLSKSQADILRVLGETGGLEPRILAEKLGMKLPELERELATLRHMEKIRGQMQAGKKNHLSVGFLKTALFSMSGFPKLKNQ